MLEAKLQRASILKRVFESIKDMVTDVNLECDDTGMKLQAMDSSNVALVAMKINDVGFVHYRCDRDRSLGLNMPTLCKVFKLCGNNDSVAIQNEDDSDSATFIFENTEEEKISTFSMKLVSIESDTLGVPDDDAGDAKVTMPSREFTNIIRNLTDFSDTVKVEVDKQGIKFITTGDMGGGEIILKPRDGSNEDDAVDLKVTNPVSQSYAIKYLNLFAKAGCLADSVALQLSEQRPVEVRFEITDVYEREKNKIGYIKYYLAPKMDEEESYGDTNMDM